MSVVAVLWTFIGLKDAAHSDKKPSVTNIEQAEHRRKSTLEVVAAYLLLYLFIFPSAVDACLLFLTTGIIRL